MGDHYDLVFVATSFVLGVVGLLWLLQEFPGMAAIEEDAEKCLVAVWANISVAASVVSRLRAGMSKSHAVIGRNVLRSPCFFPRRPRLRAIVG